jgi:hypothetical protein
VKALASRLHASLVKLPPEQMPLLLAVGLVIGVFPIMGFPTVFCLMAAFGLRLNAAALQLLNSLSSPLQLALLIPLAHVGDKLCGQAAAADGSWATRIGTTALHAMAGWACVCIPLGVLLYLSLLFAMPRDATQK